jgi:hypothetical protein
MDDTVSGRKDTTRLKVWIGDSITSEPSGNQGQLSDCSSPSTHAESWTLAHGPNDWASIFCPSQGRRHQFLPTLHMKRRKTHGLPTLRKKESVKLAAIERQSEPFAVCI